MNTDEKVCPRCAETVKAAASVCGFVDMSLVERINPLDLRGSELKQTAQQARIGQSRAQVKLSELDAWSCLDWRSWGR